MLTKLEIAEKLKNARINAGMTQIQAAERVGRKQQTLASWEIGQSQPDANTLFTLCKIYGVSVDKTFGFDKQDVCLQCNSDEQAHIKKYRLLDEYGKETVNFILDREYSRIAPAKAAKETSATAPANDRKLTRAQKEQIMKEQFDAEEKGQISSVFTTTNGSGKQSAG